MKKLLGILLSCISVYTILCLCVSGEKISGCTSLPYLIILVSTAREESWSTHCFLVLDHNGAQPGQVVWLPSEMPLCHFQEHLLILLLMEITVKFVKETSGISFSCIPIAKMTVRRNHSFIPYFDESVGSRFVL